MAEVSAFTPPALLDAPTQPNERLKRTMTTNAPWDEA
jgi:uncharacterized protein (DUF1778 family)